MKKTLSFLVSTILVQHCFASESCRIIPQSVNTIKIGTQAVECPGGVYQTSEDQKIKSLEVSVAAKGGAVKHILLNNLPKEIATLRSYKDSKVWQNPFILKKIAQEGIPDTQIYSILIDHVTIEEPIQMKQLINDKRPSLPKKYDLHGTQ
ncbi:MAG: hypothetical protein ACXWRE_13885 [Pseudobdellovibrionaceae bacterium]